MEFSLLPLLFVLISLVCSMINGFSFVRQFWDICSDSLSLPFKRLTSDHTLRQPTTMPTYQSFSAYIVVDGKPLDEHNVKISVVAGMTTVLCWIPSETGKVCCAYIVHVSHWNQLCDRDMKCIGKTPILPNLQAGAFMWTEISVQVVLHKPRIAQLSRWVSASLQHL